MFRIAFAVLLSVVVSRNYAQAPETPVQYMDFLTSREQELSKKYLSYMSEVAHGNRARKMEKRRQELISAIRQSLNDVNRLKPFKGDATLRDVFKNYWDILLKVFNEDYHKIVDMEEIAEQSYDNMEAYLMAQEKASEVLSAASDKLEPAYNDFAARNNVRLIDNGDTKMEKKLRQVSRVNHYYHQVFLIFFKNYKQEIYVLDAYEKKDINGLEQNRNTLIKVSDEGLAKLDTMKDFSNDGSLKNAVRKVIEFHKAEANNQVPGLMDYIMKNDEFNRIRKAYEAKASKASQADVDAYNGAVKTINDAINSSNKIIADSYAGRQKVMEHWENTRRRFMESYIPKGNK